MIVMIVMITVPVFVMMLHCTPGSLAQNVLYSIRNVSILEEKPGVDGNGGYDGENVLELVVRVGCLIDNDIPYEVEQWS